MKCQLLMTGNELMSGVTIDSNSSWMAEQLLDIGIGVDKKVTVGDQLEDLQREIRDAIAHHDLLIINGGLGPTVDDLTAQALAEVCQQALRMHPAAEQHVQQWCQQRGVHANAANLKQALLPAEAEIIPNGSGSAVGIQLQHNRCLVLCTPGVPTEMKQMMEQSILPFLQKRLQARGAGYRQPYIKRLQVFGMGESAIQQKIHNEYPDWPSAVALGFRAGFPTLEVKLTVYHADDLPLRQQVETRLRALLGTVIFGEGAQNLAGAVIELLRQRQQRITVAESCTGGLIASQLTAVAGASQVFDAGFVTYSDKMKQAMLGVDPLALQQHGAVSEIVVQQMLAGALQRSSADYGIAVSGIAGPDGGSAEKPVGTVWIAWGQSQHIKTRQLCYPAERKIFQAIVAAYGLDLIRRELEGITEAPRYFK